MQHALKPFITLVLVLVLGGLLLPAQPTHAAGFVVTTTNPTGPGSLADAIAQANLSAGPNTITFNLSAIPTQPGGYWQINVTTQEQVMPSLTGGNTTIDASVGGVPKVALSLVPSDPSNPPFGSGFAIQSANNTIKGFIINGWTSAGILLTGISTTGNKILGNYIGTNWNGTTALLNSDAGVAIRLGASNNQIGGPNTGERNVISGNGTRAGDGQVEIASDPPLDPAEEMSGNVVEYNYIGTTAAGNAGLTGGAYGVALGGNAIKNTVGPGNVISGINTPKPASLFPPFGVYVNADYAGMVAPANVIKGNIIGLSADGTAALPNGNAQTGGGGIRVSQETNGGQTIIGGSDVNNPNERNIIAGHTGSKFYGILLDGRCRYGTSSSSTMVQNNLIGVNGSGTAIANTVGVRIASNETFGGSNVIGPCNNSVGPGNVISGNTRYGVQIDGFMEDKTVSNPKNNAIRGNLIGTNVAGTAAIPNDTGVYLRGFATNNAIDANLISGNNNGVRVEGDLGQGTLTTANTPNANTFTNNKIGTNANGSAAVGNTAAGVQLRYGAYNNVVGPGNVISGQGGAGGVGVLLTDSGTTGNKVVGNVIGANASNSAGVPNTVGVRIVNDPLYGIPTGNSIGDVAAAPNQISYNANNGIAIVNASNNTVANNNLVRNTLNGITVQGGSGDRITHTTTAQNGANGIDLSNNGNASRQAPTLTVNGTTLNGSAPGCANCVVELYSNDTPGDAGEGNIFLSDTTRTDGSGNFSVPLPISGCKPFLVATVTDTSNNTSPFSNQVGPVVACQPAVANVQLSAATPPAQTANPGQTVTYIHQLSNTGTADAVVTLSLQSNQGWATLSPPQTSYTLKPGDVVQLTVTVAVPANAQGGVVDTTTLTANVAGGSSLSQTDTTTVRQIFGFVFDPPTRQSSASPGTSVDYTHYITNTGNGTDSFTLSPSNTAAAQGVTVSFPTCNPCVVNAGQGRAIVVRVTVAANSLALVDVATITATSAGGATAQVVDTTQIQQVPIPSLTPATAALSGKPGATLVFTHTLKNVGAAAGTFSVSAAPVGTLPSGVTVATQPAGTFPLVSGATRTVTLTVTLPATPASAAGTSFTVKLTASAGAGNPTAEANDTVTVLLAPAVTFAPNRTGSGAPGQTVLYTHYITNTGNGAETFNFTSSAPTGWNVVVIDPTTLQPLPAVTLASGAGRTVLGAVTIPTSNPISSSVFITATAATDASVQASVKDTTAIVSAAVPQLDGPKTVSTDPGVGVPIVHTLTNIGNAAGSFDATLDQLPTGWTFSVVQSPAGSLAPGNAATLTVVVTPTANAAFGSYPVRLRVTAQDTNRATTLVVDTVNVNKKARLAIAPPYNDLRNPGTVVTYTHTLTNSGNFTDTVTLTARSSLPWAVQVAPTTTTLAPGATQQVTVTLTIPSGILAGTVNTTTITATSAGGAQATVQDRTTIRAVPGVQLTPTTQLLSGDATKPVTFTFKLLNSGSVAQDYTLVATPPALSGWTVTVVPLSVANIQPGQEVAVQVVVTAPAGTPDGTVGDTILRATSSVAPTDPVGPPPSATATARLIVGPAYRVDIAPDRAANVLPGRIYTYSHVVTNTGLLSDTFLLSTRSLLGWQVQVTPSSLVLAPGATTPVTVTVVVPSTAEANVVETTQVIVRSATKPTIFDSVTDTSTVQRVAGVSISPDLVSTTSGGTQIEFQHRVVNTGNSPDTFVITATSTLNWSVTIVPTTTPELLPGFSYPVLVRVTAPAGNAPGVFASITVRATSRLNAAVFDEARDRLGTPSITTTRNNKVYLPIVVR